MAAKENHLSVHDSGSHRPPNQPLPVAMTAIAARGASIETVKAANTPYPKIAFLAFRDLLNESGDWRISGLSTVGRVPVDDTSYLPRRERPANGISYANNTAIATTAIIIASALPFEKWLNTAASV